MKKSTLFITIWSLLIALSTLSFAEETTMTVPESVWKSCILTESGMIDFCPTYRSQIRDLNIKLSQKWTQIEWSGSSSLLTEINKSFVNFRLDQILHKKNALQWYPLFIYEYESYLTQLFAKYITQHFNESQIVSSFFKESYFDADQSGLGISNIRLYDAIPKRYDDEIILQVGIRNYTRNPISNIEDLYCFTTIGNEDYIYPLQVQTSFKESTITNLIVWLKPATSPLVENIGEKKIFCMLVYSQYWKMRYTNRWSLSFIMK
jgi:hypothetical protein